MRDRAGRLSGLVALAIAATPVSAADSPAPFPADYRLGPVALPKPGGKYAVGTMRFELARADGTPLPVVAWYPAAPGSAPDAPYAPADEHAVSLSALRTMFRWPAATLDGLKNTRANATTGAPVARGRFPLLIYSHGFLMYPRQNSALMEHLASAGYIILSVTHPGDSTDLPSSKGILPTKLAPPVPDPDPKATEAFWTAPDRETQRQRLPAMMRSPAMLAMEAKLTVWRDDMRRAADATLGRTLPTAALPIAKAVKRGPIAYLGMSFGGSTSASLCAQDKRCAAAINLDGIEFDRTLYDRAYPRPFLLIQADWRSFPNAGPPGRAFSPYDLAYESKASAGRDPNIHRYRLNGIRHMGFTDLILAPRDAVRDAIFGTVDGARATEALNAITLTFLDQHLRKGRADVADVATLHPVMTRHSAASSD